MYRSENVVAFKRLRGLPNMAYVCLVGRLLLPVLWWERKPLDLLKCAPVFQNEAAQLCISLHIVR